jgi:hypothetical protein
MDYNWRAAAAGARGNICIPRRGGTRRARAGWHLLPRLRACLAATELLAPTGRAACHRQGSVVRVKMSASYGVEGDHLVPDESKGAAVRSATGGAAATAPEAELTAAIPYAFFSPIGGGTAEGVTEYHQATCHFVLQPSVPLWAKLKFLFTSAGILALQLLGLCAILGNIEEMAVQDIFSQYQEMRNLDYYMHVLLALMVGFVVNAELQQARVAELMIWKACASNDPGAAASAQLWAIPLLLIQRGRYLMLVPITVMCSPILAIQDGLDAKDVALNVMAILFVLDFDDGAFSCFLSKPQHKYLESVETTLTAADHNFLTWQIVFSVLASLAACVLPVVLFDPRWKMSDADEQPNAEVWAGFFAPHEPLKSCSLLGTLSFGSVAMLQLLWQYGAVCRGDIERRPRELCNLSFEMLCSSAMIVITLVIGLYGMEPTGGWEEGVSAAVNASASGDG